MNHAQHVRAFPKPTPNAGTGLLPIGPISRGHYVVDTPADQFTVLNGPALEDTCSTCFRDVDCVVPGEEELPLKVCGGCQVLKYCGKACQSRSWSSGHKYECAIYKKLQPNVLPNTVRLILRIALLHEKKKLDPLETNMMIDLTHHIPEAHKTNREHIRDLVFGAKAVREYSETTELTISKILEWFGKLDTNGFSVVSPFYDYKGICLNPFASFINHSCDPNSIVGFDQGRIAVKALRDIEQDEEITISYIENTNPFERRQTQLRERYFFTCKCSKCEKGTQSREDQFLKNPSELNAQELHDAEQESRAILEATRTEKTRGLPLIRKLESAMMVLRKTRVWPFTRQPYVKLRNELIPALLEVDHFTTAFLHCVIRYLRIDPVIYPEGWHPVRNAHAWVLVKLMQYINAERVPMGPGEDARIVSRYSLNFNFLVYSVLERLNKNLHFELPTAQKIYRTTFEHVRKDFERAGKTQAQIKKEVDEEWKKVGNMVDEALCIDEAL